MGNRQRRASDETFEAFPRRQRAKEAPARAGFWQARQQHLINEAFVSLVDELVDPALDELELTWVALSDDGKVLRVYWQGPAPAAIEAALARAAPFLRVRLAEVLGGKHVPLVCFERDPRLV